MVRRAMIPLCRPVFAGREREYLEECLSSGWVATGRFIEAFEDALSKRLSGGHIVTVNSGTTALTLALRAIGIRGGTVIVPALTFKATANAVRAAGGIVSFRDVDPQTWTVIPHSEATLTIPVHFNGVPAESLPRAMTVEDAAGALGSTWWGQAVASRDGAMAGIVSLNAQKIVTAGGGGAIVTRFAPMADFIRSLSRHTRNGDETQGEANLRLSNLQAAVGLGQIEQLDEFLEAKRRIAARYTAELDGRFRPQRIPDGSESNDWLYTVRCENAAHRERVQAAAQHAGIEVRRLWKPLAPLPVATTIYDEAISLPCSVDLTEADQARVIRCIRSA